MCGIFGIITNTDTSGINTAKVKESAMLMRHRGPDAYGQWGIPGKIELAHLRLAIIDLNKESNQPFFSNRGRYVIVFNGEIYNYLEIRRELQSLGYAFRTSSDTEVLLNSYIEWGEQCVSKFNGDWSFAIYNIPENTLFCSRDRFGVKPFNYSIINGKFIFSSEVKSILHYFPELRHPNYNVIANYCRNSLGAQCKETWFDGIYRLLPAHNLIWKDGRITIKKYWEYPSFTFHDITLEEAKNLYRKTFINAVRLRMRSDVAVGTTLSSGLDSSSIVSVLRRFYFGQHKTFTASFNATDFQKREEMAYRGDIKINEGAIVKQLAEQLDLDAHIIHIHNIDLVRELSDIIYYLESGHSSPAILPLARILDYARSRVTVIMEGQGADELLGGYILNTFLFLLYELAKRGNIAQLAREISKFKEYYSINYALKMLFRLLNNDSIERFYYWWTGLNEVFGPKLRRYKRIKDFPLDPKKFSERFTKELFKMHTGGLVNLLHYGDAISMSRSMESRNPFVDVNLVEFVFRLPFNYKIHDGLGKYIHRVSMDGIVPEFILENPIKFGFNTPLSSYFDSIDSEANRILLSERCLDRGIFDRSGLQRLVVEHINKTQDHSTRLFRFLSVELWFRVFIDR